MKHYPKPLIVFGILFSILILYYGNEYRNRISSANDYGSEKSCSNPRGLESMLNLPEWYRTKDWGLKKNANLDQIKVRTRGLDKEELTSWNHFFFGTSGGIMLEMGAMNGRDWSVSYFYEQQANWRSILIEANPTLASQLSIHRPNALSFNVAICDTPGTVHFLDQGNGLGGGGGILEFMSEGYLKSLHSRWLTGGQLDWKKVEKDKRVKVLQCIPLTDLLQTLQIDYISFFLLDVEGGELNILKAIDFDKIRFDVVAVETDRGTDKAPAVKEYVDAVTEIMTRNGYKLWQRKVGRNSWYYAENFQPFNSSSANPNLKVDPKFKITK